MSEPGNGRPPLERVVLKDVGRRYGRRAALDGVTLTVRRGRPCVIMGENGAGKSTLVGLVGQVIQPSVGVIRYETADGEVTGRELRRRIGLVTHRPMVYPELSALENVTFFARIGGIGDPVGQARQVLEELGLDPESPQPAGQLSRGMQARLAVARALVIGPELLLLDEAVSGLDRAGSRSLLRLVARVAPERLVLLATHNVSAAAEVAHQFVLLHRGRVRRDDDLSERSLPERRDHITEAIDASG